MKKNLLTTLFIALFLCVFSSSLYAATFTKSDLAGTWRGSWLETSEDANGRKYTLSVDLVIDNAGNFSSGTWVSSGGQTGNITGGSLAITSHGHITGAMEYGYDDNPLNGPYANNSGYTITIVHGQLDLDKNVVSLAMTKPGLLATGVLCKYSATNNMDVSQLNDSWKVFWMESDPDNDFIPYWVSIFLMLAPTDSGSFVTSDAPDPAMPLAAVDKALQPDGALTGRLTISKNIASGIAEEYWDIEKGQVGLAKNIGSLMARRTASSGGDTLAAGVMIRSGSGFINSDMAGDWSVFHSQHRSSTNEMYWVYSEITVDSEGNVTKGTWTRADMASGTYSGGSFIVTESGYFNGSLAAAGGVQFQIGGQLGKTKNYGAGNSFSTGNMFTDNLFFVRKPVGASNINIPTMMLLLN